MTIVHPMNMCVIGQLAIHKSFKFQNQIWGPKITLDQGEDSLSLSLSKTSHVEASQLQF